MPSNSSRTIASGRKKDSLREIQRQVVACTRCSRLVAYRCQVAEQKRRRPDG